MKNTWKTRVRLFYSAIPLSPIEKCHLAEIPYSLGNPANNLIILVNLQTKKTDYLPESSSLIIYNSSAAKQISIRNYRRSPALTRLPMISCK